MASVTFPAAVGGDGSTVTDDTNPTTGLGAGGHRVRFVPALAQLVAVSQFVVNAAQGVANAFFLPVRVASTGNINLLAPGATIDGETMVNGDRFLAKNQSVPSENGIYIFNGSAVAATRATDADANNEWAPGKCVAVSEGTDNEDTVWLVTNDGAITVGSTAIAFARFPSLGKPNTWTALQTYTVGLSTSTGTAASINIGTNGKMAETDQAIGSLTSGAIIITHNAVYNAGWKKIAAGFATAEGVAAGIKYFYVSNAGAGSPGDAITWTLLGSINTAGLANFTTLQQNSVGVVTQGKHSMFIPAQSFVRQTTAGPSAVLGAEQTTTNLLMYQYYDFDGTTRENICAMLDMPKHYNNGTISFEAIWRPLGGSGTEGVVWGMGAVAISDGDAYDAAYGTEVEVTDNRQSSNTVLHRSAESGAVTPAGTPAVGDRMAIRVFRNPAAAGDTLTAIDARFFGIRLFYTSDKANDA